MTDYSKYIISSNATIKEALVALNNLSNDALVLFAVNEKGTLEGTVTDGDIRRHLINDGDLTSLVNEVMNRNFKFIESLSDVSSLKKYREIGYSLIPYLSPSKEILRIINLKKKKSFLPIDAVLMAGGKGERLRPLTEKTPKPLLPVGEKAIIDYNVDSLISHGVENVYVTVNYLREQIEEHFCEERDGVKVTCVREPKFLGTIGSIQFIETFQNDTVLVMNSDLFTNIDYEDFYLHYKLHDADMSIAAVPYGVSVPYGIFELDGRDVKGIKEKPTYNYYANAGIYLIRKKHLELIPKDAFYNATDFMELLIRNQMKVVRFPLTGYWIDIGKHEEYRKAQDLVKHL